MTSSQKVLASVAVAALALAGCGGGGTVDLGGFGFTSYPIKKGDGFLVGILVKGPAKGDLEVLEVSARTSPNVTFAGISRKPLGGGGFESSLGEVLPLPAKIPPDDEGEYDFAAGFKVGEGLGALHGIDVTWRVGGKKKKGHFDVTGITCSEPGLYDSKDSKDKQCQPEDDRDFEKKTLAQFGLDDD